MLGLIGLSRIYFTLPMEDTCERLSITAESENIV